MRRGEEARHVRQRYMRALPCGGPSTAGTAVLVCGVSLPRGHLKLETCMGGGCVDGGGASTHGVESGGCVWAVEV